MVVPDVFATYATLSAPRRQQVILTERTCPWMKFFALGHVNRKTTAGRKSKITSKTSQIARIGREQMHSVLRRLDGRGTSFTCIVLERTVLERVRSTKVLHSLDRCCCC